MFPGAGANVYYNEAGEPIGWDAPDDGPYDPYDYDLDPDPDYDEDDEDDEPERVPHGENHDYDVTHRHTPECDSMTCYEKYVDLEYEGPEGPQVMTYEAWKRT